MARLHSKVAAYCNTFIGSGIYSTSKTSSLRHFLHLPSFHGVRRSCFSSKTMGSPIPQEFMSHFKYSEYQLIRPLDMVAYTEGRYGHLLWNNLMEKGDFHMQTYVNASKELLEGEGKEPVITKAEDNWYVDVFVGNTTRNFVTQFIYLINVGTFCCGHVGVWHGGVTSALFDNAFGVLGCTLLKKAATKNLTINFKAPVMVGDTVALVVSFDPAEISAEKMERFVARGEMYNQHGAIVATSESELVDVSQRWAAKTTQV